MRNATIDALAEITNPKHATTLDRAQKAADATRQAVNRAYTEAERHMKPFVTTIKRYVAKRLKEAKLRADFDSTHRGWFIGHKDKRPKCHLSLTVRLPNQMQVTTSITCQNIAELNKSLDAIIYTATMLREQAEPPKRLGVVG